MSGLALAGRYAKALFELAAKDNSFDNVEKDLAQLVKAVAENNDLATVLKNPSISKTQVMNLLSLLLKKMGAGKLSENFVRVVVSNGRAKYLAEIVSAYSVLTMQRRGEEFAYVTTATKLGEKQVGEIEKTIGSSLGKKIKAVVAVNDEILGGIIVRIGSKMLDASLSGQLVKLSNINRKAIANLN